jgi:hypothetical protein
MVPDVHVQPVTRQQTLGDVGIVALVGLERQAERVPAHRDQHAGGHEHHAIRPQPGA